MPSSVVETLICASGTLFLMWAAARATSLAKACTSSGMLFEICVNFIAYQEVFHTPFEPRKNGVEQLVQPGAGFLRVERLCPSDPPAWRAGWYR